MERIVFLINEECLVAAIQFSYFHNLISPHLTLFSSGCQPREQPPAREVATTRQEAGQDEDLDVPRVQGEVRGDQHTTTEHGIQGTSTQYTVNRAMTGTL